MSYVFDTNPTVLLPKKADNAVVVELLSNYTYSTEWNVIFSEQNYISIGNYEKAEYSDAEYVINVTDGGVYVAGNDYPSTMRGFLSFLERIKYSEQDNSFYIENCCITEKPLISFRCTHLCIFPETEFDFLKKCIRSCAIAKFSHIILEFWGMLKFDCMKELSWPFAYTKEKVRELVKEANALGVEIIPMFNHLGHASAAREIRGKHVVLDQNPRYEYLFESYGWIWNIKRADVRKLLADVRNELMEVCGEGKYFHLGCDEAYAYGHETAKAHEMVEFLNGISKELNAKGRRGIIWHDMLLSNDEFKGYCACSDKDVADILINNIDKELIIADWQYSVHNETWTTSRKFKEKGFDVLCCPWNNVQNVDEAIDTVLSNGLFGIIHTTWHTLHGGFREMIYAGVYSYGTSAENREDIQRFYAADVARKALPAFGDYEKGGWSRKMTGPGL